MDNEMNEDEICTVTLTFEDDVTVECDVVAIFPLNDKYYMAMCPIENVEEFEEDEIFIYRYFPEDENNLYVFDEVKLEAIEDDDEYELVADELERIFLEAEEDEDVLDE